MRASNFSIRPIVNGDGSRLLGFEALLRLRDENGEYISPSVFVPIAEARGYIKAIGTWVIREATRQIAQWPQDLFVSVNLSPVQFGDGDLVRIVETALRDANISGKRLEIEVVESLLLDRSDDILAQLRELRALGISIDMDDFGTGYSSLGYLWRFPFDKLKIDQSFMVALENGEPNVSRLLETIVSMAHHLKMKVTTEGVETEAQVALMKSLGCDQLQGYFFGRPMPADQAAAEILTRFRHNVAESPSDVPVLQRANHAS
ncbi:EAL domain-containing protein [Aurantimonas sp. C2-6-R+9]|uniref:EAL domain-containing protein n=1 Tax=unclassified Aurantimonas TaxID=2638230 RepID=UPI002E17FF2C|nr:MULTISPECIES: EAL domain-containing protein [unclassified Aurantimonas]MEC5292631.1 EAL domain-containing protein [Aurantimonas sp. C2-3-R2]MEC5382855.1 EAL domain-containing protein [Aurantimonas sp. C2-6-R+9]MEC5413686.1 EAL domain-containing protein [Aurantimonas sp. C2-4-R8]